MEDAPTGPISILQMAITQGKCDAGEGKEGLLASRTGSGVSGLKQGSSESRT